MSADWIRFTPALVICFQAAASEPLSVDAAAGVLDHVGREADLARIERAPRDAEVGRQAGRNTVSMPRALR